MRSYLPMPAFKSGFFPRPELRAHVRSLLKEHKATLCWNPFLECSGVAYNVSRVIEMRAPVHTPRLYAVFLHELGHVVSPGQIHMELSTTFDELDAWSWAKRHAIYWDDLMHDFSITCMKTYGLFLD